MVDTVTHILTTKIIFKQVMLAAKGKSMKPVLTFLYALLVSTTLAQGTISGTLYASEVNGFVVLACLLDAAMQNCDDQSPLVTITESGPSARFQLNGRAGDYYLYAWKDSNSNGKLEEDQDEVGFFSDSSNQPALVTAPAFNLDIHVASATNPLTAQGDNPLLAQPQNASTKNTNIENTTETPSSLADVVGIWQMTRDSGGDYQNPVTGESFSMGIGYNVLLKIRADGSYQMQFYTPGDWRSCSSVFYRETSLGTARVSGNQLVLQPTQHTLELQDCTSSSKHDLDSEATTYTMTLREDVDDHTLRVLKLRLEGGALNLELDLLNREPLAPGYQPAQPADFVLGTDPAYPALLGLWTPDEKSEVEFYNPDTGAFILPEDDVIEDSYVRFDEHGYELARFWNDYTYPTSKSTLGISGNVCQKDYLYYERGTPSFSVTEPAQIPNGVSVGHVRFEASETRLIVNLRNCDEDTGELRYTLEPLVSYYKWYYVPAAPDDIIATAESVSLHCEWEKSAWQFMVCDSALSTNYGDGSSKQYTRRQ